MTDPMDTLDAAIRLARKHKPGPILEHWCDVDGVRYPPKQVHALLSGAPRSTFTSHQALRALNRLGFTTSEIPKSRNQRSGEAATETDTLTTSFVTLGAFLTDVDLTSHLASAEKALAGANRASAERAMEAYAFSEDLLDAALMMRSRFGRINDIVHATVIARILPQILGDSEVVHVRPSLAAGNSPDRPFDLETDQRIAEFKVSQWKGSDTMRKRGVFADLAHLAADCSGRRAQLYVVGERPIRHLTTSTSPAYDQLARSSENARTTFVERFGTASMTVAEFTAGPAAHVELIDLTTLIPALSDS
ncbi:hypothetical protein [Prescottella equi]